MILILLAVAILWVAGYADKPDPFVLYQPIELFFIQFFAVSLGGAGVVSMLRGLALAPAKKLPTRTLPRIFPELPLRNVTAWNKPSPSHSLIPPMLNAFSVSWICVLMTLVIIFMMNRPLPPKGLRIDWTRRSHIASIESPWSKTMSVYVEHSGQFYVNGKVIKQELEKALREELGQRAEWTVYVEADYDTPFMDTVYVIDMIQGLGAKVVWITPRTRAEWNEERGSPGYPESQMLLP